MTDTEADPAPASPVLVSVGEERQVLEAFLDFHRGVIRAKASGLSEENARRRLVPSQTTVAGLLVHLAVVERNWFGLLAVRTGAQPAPDEEGEDNSWVVDPTCTVDSLLKQYLEACAHSRETAAGVHLDTAVPHPQLGQVSLRWIYVHMIEETARHAGHADILREQLDGVVGAAG